MENKLEILGSIFFTIAYGCIALLNAAIAKKLGLHPLLGFILGLFCPGISTGVLFFFAKARQTL